MNAFTEPETALLLRLLRRNQDALMLMLKFHTFRLAGAQTEASVADELEITKGLIKRLEKT